MRVLRAAFAVVAGSLATVAASIAAAVVLPFAPDGRLGCAVMRLWSRAVLRAAGVRLEVTGLEHVRDSAHVIVANHGSMLDICALSAALPMRFNFVSRPFFFKVPFLGWGMWFARHVALDPRRPREAAKVLGSLGGRFARGWSLLLFPEGTRSPDGRVGTYRRGPFLLAIGQGIPVLPVRLTGLAERLPKGSLWARPGPAGVTVGAPVPTAGMEDRDARALAQRVEDWTRGA